MEKVLKVVEKRTITMKKKMPMARADEDTDEMCCAFFLIAETMRHAFYQHLSLGNQSLAAEIDRCQLHAGSTISGPEETTAACVGG
jgi:hypothetical protein